MERIGRGRSPRGQRRVFGESGEERFQLDFRAKRIRWPFRGNSAETLLRMSELVCC